MIGIAELEKGLARLSNPGPIGTYSLGDNTPGLIPIEALLVNKNALKFDNSKSWMRIVQLNGDLLREFEPCTLGLLESADNIVQRGSNPEVLLLQTKLLTTVKVVIRVQDGADGLRTLLISYGALVVTAVEFLEIEFSTSSFAGPETQVVGSWGFETGNWHIVGNGFDNLTTFPDNLVYSLRILVFSDTAIELDLLAVSLPPDATG